MILLRQFKPHVLLAVILALGLVLPVHTQAAAATVTVNTVVDESDGSCSDGDCSLRDAIAIAAPGDTITFAPTLAGQAILLNATLAINKNLTIDGPPPTGTGDWAPLRLDGRSLVGVFSIQSGTVTLSHLAIVNGVGEGAGIYNTATLNLADSVIAANRVSGMFKYGGGIYNRGTLTVRRTYFANNSAEYTGGAIDNRGTLTVFSCSFVSNIAGGLGGAAVYNDDAQTSIQNSTFYQNSTGTTASGALTNDGGNMTARLYVGNSTLIGNTGGILNKAGQQLYLDNSILADNGGSDCSGVTWQGHNNLVKGSDHCTLVDGVDGNMLDIDPALAPLSDNQGATQTFMPMPGSPVLDAGAPSYCADTDQRDVPRPLDGNGDGVPVCDIGAVEYDGPAAPSTVTVTSASDSRDWNCLSGDCVLRDAIPSVAPGGRIVFAPSLAGQAIALQSELFIEKNLTISSEVPVTISSGAGRVFDVRRGNVTFDGLTIANGHGSSDDCSGYALPCGGGINIKKGAVVTIASSTLSGNVATFGGGVANSGLLTVRDSNFLSNGAGNQGGGGIANYQTAQVTVTNSLFQGNQAGSGGALQTQQLGGIVVVEDSQLSANAATTRGGAVDLSSGGEVTIRRSRLTDNTATDGDGGAVGIYTSGTVTIEDSTVSGNRATGRGGGLYNSGGALTVRRSTIADNQITGAQGQGGGIYTFDETLIENSTIAGNRSTQLGGGIFHMGDPSMPAVVISNNTISGNEAGLDVAGYGGGIYNNESKMILQNNTIYGNQSGAVGGGIRNDGDLTMINNIIAGSSRGGDCSTQTQSIDARYNLIQGPNLCNIVNGLNGNITGANPLLGPLADNGGPTKTHALLPGSPAIDAGTMVVTADQRGVPRPQDGDGDGVALPDIGAYEAGLAPLGHKTYLPLAIKGG